MAIFSTILALLQAIPILDRWVREFLVFYAKKQEQWFYEAVAKAIVDSIEKRDQTPIEDVIKSPRAGKESGHDGVEYENLP